MQKLVSVLQVRRQGEADAQLWHPVIRPAVSPPANRLPGLGLVRGGVKGTGRQWHGSDAQTARKKRIPAAACGGWNYRHNRKIHSFYSQKITSYKTCGIVYIQG